MWSKEVSQRTSGLRKSACHLNCSATGKEGIDREGKDRCRSFSPSYFFFIVHVFFVHCVCVSLLEPWTFPFFCPQARILEELSTVKRRQGDRKAAETFFQRSLEMKGWGIPLRIACETGSESPKVSDFIRFHPISSAFIPLECAKG